MKLMILVLNRTDVLEYLLEDFDVVGIKGATIISTDGMGAVLSRLSERSWSESIKDIFNINSGSKTIFAVISEEKFEIAKKVIRNVVGDLNEPNTGVLFTVPVDFVDGIRK